MKALIIGGSIAGLFTAAFLSRLGWETKIFERSEKNLSERGAGIVTHEELLGVFSEIDVDASNLGVVVQDRVVFDKSDNVILRVPFKQIVTSWDRIHQLLKEKCKESNYFSAHALSKYEINDSGVIATFENGSKHEGDILIGADGFASKTRSQLLPDIKSTYSGYVGWRALADEKDLMSDMGRKIFPTFSFFTPPGTQIIGYPIAGINNDLREGKRRYNIVWYKDAPSNLLREMLTDNNDRQHEITIPPPLIREQFIEQMRSDACELLPNVFREILGVSSRPFFTPIYDHHCQTMGMDRIALVGDAACVARPHVGMGVTKAALDAKTLVECLGKFKDIKEGIAAFSEIRVQANLSAHLLARRLGNYIFAGEESDNDENGRNPNLHDIVNLTAAMVH